MCALQKYSPACRMQGAHRLQFRQALPETNGRYEYIEELLAELAPPDPAAQAAAG